MRCVPNLVVMAPADENECRQMLYTGFLHDGPASVRYPRGKGPGVEVEQTMQALEIGKAEVRKKGQRIALLGFGCMVQPAMEIADSLEATVVNMRFVKPLDEQLLIQIADNHDILVTLEDNVVAGGAGSAVNEFLQSRQINTPILNIGLPDAFIEHGSREECLSDAGLDKEGIHKTIAAYLKNRGSMGHQKTG